MSEVTQEAPRRLRWKLWQALLLPVPGLVFSFTWSVMYHRNLEGFILQSPGPPAEGQWMRHSLGAAASSFGFSVLAGVAIFFLVAVTLAHTMRSRPGQPGAGAGILGLLLIVVNLTVCFAGCSLGERSARGFRPTFPPATGEGPLAGAIWRASTDSGDKPGIGIELRTAGYGYLCSVFVLNPNSPHDFSKGRKCPTEVTRVEKDRQELTVEWSPDRSESLGLVFPEGVKDETFPAILTDMNSTKPGTTYEFRRLR